MRARLLHSSNTTRTHLIRYRSDHPYPITNQRRVLAIVRVRVTAMLSNATDIRSTKCRIEQYIILYTLRLA